MLMVHINYSTISSEIWPTVDDSAISHSYASPSHFAGGQNIEQHCAFAVGATSGIHDHLKDVAEKWKKYGNAVKGQLQKVGLQADDLEDKYELLLSLADRYCTV